MEYEKGLDMDSGNGCTMMQMVLKPQKYTFKNNLKKSRRIGKDI